MAGRAVSNELRQANTIIITKKKKKIESSDLLTKNDRIIPTYEV